MSYPEHEKLKNIKFEKAVVQSFLDWLEDQDWKICDYNDYEIPQGKESIMAMFFDIDLQKLSEEKNQMYQELIK